MTSKPMFPRYALVRDDNPEFEAFRVTGSDASTIELSVPSGVRRRVARNSNTLRRVQLPRGARVLIDGEILDAPDPIEGVVCDTKGINEQTKLFEYDVEVAGTRTWVSEAYLYPAPPRNDTPLHLLEDRVWRGPRHFFHRWAVSRTQREWFEMSEGIPALVGARVRPMAHQLYAARRVFWDRSPRFILADEVGLGKTIEAGLVIQALTAGTPELRVLVIAPGGMSRQWLCELYHRFGSYVYDHVTASRLDSGNVHAFADSKRLIVSTTALVRHPEFGKALLARKWDLLVIDEAHQLVPSSPLYALCHALSRKADGVLVLSATPSKGQAAGLVALLSLVAPDVYDPAKEQGLIERLAIQDKVNDKLGYAMRLDEGARREPEELDTETLADVASEFSDLFKGDTIIDTLLERLRAGVREALTELITYVQEFHRVDHRIIRMRRRALETQGMKWSARCVEPHSYAPTTCEAILIEHFAKLPDPATESNATLALRWLYQRALCTTPNHLAQTLVHRQRALNDGRADPRADEALTALLGDPSPEDEERLMALVLDGTPALPGEKRWLKEALSHAQEWVEEAPFCGRFRAVREWIVGHLRASATNRVLVFSQEASVVDEFVRFLASSGMPDVLAFHHGINEVELTQICRKFQKEPRHRVLVSNELGGEGRNFQMASAVVHLDQPWSVARLEQRIGRLDRIGRNSNRAVLSVVVHSEHPLENAFFNLHREVFRVYNTSVGGIEFILPKLQTRVALAACRGAAHLAAQHASLRAEVEQERRAKDEAFDIFGDMVGTQLEKAKEVADLLSDSSEVLANRDQIAFRDWANTLGIVPHVPEEHLVTFSWSGERLTRALPGYEGQPGSAAMRHNQPQGTFHRDLALDDESVQYLAAGHRFIEALLADHAQSMHGRATVLFRNLGSAFENKLFLLVLLSMRPDAKLWSDKNMPAGLRARAFRHLSPREHAVPIALVLDGEPCAAPSEVRQKLLNDERHATDRKAEPEQVFALFDPPTLWAAVRAGIQLAIDEARRDWNADIASAADELRQDLANELGYLQWRAKAEQGKALRETQADIELRHQLVESVKNPEIRIEALAVIIGAAEAKRGRK